MSISYDAEAPTAAPLVRRLRAWTNLLYSGRWQAGAAAVVGLSASVVAAAAGRDDLTQLSSLGDFFAFTVGTASVLALVASITFGFLLHHIEATTTDREQYYGQFKAHVRELRRFLDEQYANGLLDGAYDFNLGYIEEITRDDFPLMNWQERIEPLSAVIEEQADVLDRDTEFGPLLRGFAYRVNDIEESVRALFENFVRRVLTRRMLDPVVKSFRTLAVVLLALVLGAVAYDPAMRAMLYPVTVALAAMTLFLILEMAMVARRETSELFEFGDPGD